MMAVQTEGCCGGAGHSALLKKFGFLGFFKKPCGCLKNQLVYIGLLWFFRKPCGCLKNQTWFFRKPCGCLKNQTGLYWIIKVFKKTIWIFIKPNLYMVC